MGSPEKVHSCPQLRNCHIRYSLTGRGKRDLRNFDRDAIVRIAQLGRQRYIMTSTYPGPRPRGPPSGRGPPPGSTAEGSGRPPPIAVNGIPHAPINAMSRAEKFEDEKRRIIESCFGKKEPDGSGTASVDSVKQQFGLRLIRNFYQCPNLT